MEEHGRRNEYQLQDNTHTLALEGRLFTTSKTQEARAAHPECRTLSNEEGRGVESWVEKRDALKFPPKHRALMRSIADLLNNEVGPSVNRLGDYFVTRFLKRPPCSICSCSSCERMDRNGAFASDGGSLRNHTEPDDM